MARIALALATSHTPQLSSPPQSWARYGERDRRNPRLLGRDGVFHDYDDLIHTDGSVDVAELEPERWQAKHDRAQAAVGSLHDTLAETSPDVVVVIGDDQDELFHDDAVP